MLRPVGHKALILDLIWKYFNMRYKYGNSVCNIWIYFIIIIRWWISFLVSSEERNFPKRKEWNNFLKILKLKNQKVTLLGEFSVEMLKNGYNDGGGCWWQMLKTKFVDDNFRTLLTLLAVSVYQDPLSFHMSLRGLGYFINVTKIEILSPTFKKCHLHKVTWWPSPTALSSTSMYPLKIK